MTLPVSRLINVSVNLTQQPAVGRNFGDLLIMGDSNVISGLERIRDYSDLSSVANDFGTTAPEYLASQLYFGQVPKPANLSIGRYLRTATAGQLLGALLSSSQSALSNFTSITSGGFTVTVDGTIVNITGLDFSALLNLNAVASAITTAFSGAATTVWTGHQFVTTSATTGAGVQASGTITFNTNAAAADTVTINGVTITFVASSPSGNQVLIGATAADTATNLNTFLNASANAGLLVSSYSVLGSVVTVTYKQVGTGGNAITLAKVSTHITLSSSTLAGGVNPSSVSYATAPGSGQDISALLGFTAALALPLVPGYNAETPLQAVIALDTISTKWYGLMFAASVQPSSSDNLAIAAFIEADLVSRQFGVTTQDSGVLSSLVSNDIASQLLALEYSRTFTQYSSTQPYVVASMFGRAFSVNYNGQNTAIDLMYKQQPGVVAEILTTAQANVLQAKHCNVFVGYNNATSIIQYGVMASGIYIDERHDLDWYQDAVQTACFNVNYTSPTKVPQTDQGLNQYANAIAQVSQQAVTAGVAAPGVWNADGFGNLTQGQFLKTGFYIFPNPISSQSESDRAARVSPPIQVALKLAGAIEQVDVLVTVNP